MAVAAAGWEAAGVAVAPRNEKSFLPIWRWRKNNVGDNKEKRQGSRCKCAREKESIKVAGVVWK